MFKLLQIYIILYLALVELHSATISDNSKDSISNDHNNIKHLYDYSSNFTFNTVQHSAIEEFNYQLFAKEFLQENTLVANKKLNAPAGELWKRGEELLYRSLQKFKMETEEDECLLDSLKVALIWWAYSNGTLKETNLHVLKYQEQLDLSYHNISSDEEVLKFIPNTSENVPDLVVLSLAYNNLSSAPFQTLQLVANNLKYLSLRGNSFKHKTNEDYVKFAAKQYSTKHMSNVMELLHWATFPYMSKLQELDISDCYIEYIGKKAFQNLTNLKNLYLSHNKILTIPSDTFANIPSLEVLDFSFDNFYYSIDNIRLIASTNFELILQFFYGINIESLVFKHLPNLKYLNLSHSKLSVISAGAFKYIGANLKYLSLCYTSFPTEGYGYLKNSPLIGLDLSGNTNAIYSLDGQVFEGLAASLIYLFFEKANLRDLSWVQPLNNLRFLALGGNNINTLLGDHFKPLKQLQILDLSSNQIGNWYSQVFKHNENLRILNLRGNNINVLTTEMLKDFGMLLYLSLGNNKFICDCVLRDLVDTATANNQRSHCNGNFWPDIQDSIHVNSIYLSEIVRSSKLFTNTSLKNLDISSLIVSHSLHKFKNMSKKLMQPIYLGNDSKIRFILNGFINHNESKFCWHINDTSRRQNSSLSKLQLLDYQDEHYWCYNESKIQNLNGLNCQRASLSDHIKKELNAVTTSVLASVGTLIFIVILGTLVYNKRWHIYYYYTSLKSAALFSVVPKDKLNRFCNLYDQNPNMMYDIFVSYCQSDRDWIVKEFMPNIEASSDISICLHERDFQVGVTILDNIVSCMERSKAIMLIISSNFLLSHWCQFEMQLAQHLIFDLDKYNLILVLLEDIPRSKRTKNLQFLMNIKTYIRYPEGKCETDVHNNGCKIFWERIKRTLRNIGLNSSQSSIA